MSNNYLGSRGYVIYKSNLTEQELLELKQELTVVPFTAEGYGQPAESFKNYQESSSKLYLPRYYALQKFGLPKINKLNDGLDIHIDFKGNLRPIQIDAIKSVLDCCNDPTKMGALLCLACGQGKCLGYDTDILMFDGSIKKVQDIKLGDKIMGDDSTPRNVLSIARGSEMMYEIIPNKGNSYKVNESHILSLKYSPSKRKFKKEDIVDISVKDYLNLPPYYHGRAGPLLGYRVSIEFPTKDIDFDPYMIGYWLGNGAKKCPEISCQDSTVLHYFAKTLPKKYNSSLTYISQYDYYISGARRKNDQHSINPFLTALQNNNLINNKHIPMIYKCNSREVRLSVLAGLLDSDGSYDGFCFDIGLTNEKLFDDLLFLARSLGFACYKTQKKTSWTYKGIKKYGVCFRTYISGEGLENIPTKIPRKRASSRKQIKNVLVTRIKVKKLQVDNYYGFEIDGNHRFILGDFTVTHNTVCGISMMCTLAKKTLIIVHKEFLLEQWKERIQEFAPSARIGLIKAKTIDVENKDIVLASLQSLSMKNYDECVFKDFGAVFLDEVHHLGAEVFSKALKKVNFKYAIGLTATPKRKDGLTKVFKWYLGDIAYESKKLKDSVEVRFHRYYNMAPEYSRIHTLYNKKPNIARMINNICEYLPRVKFIEEIILNILKEEPTRRFLILSDRRQHVHLIKDMLDVNKLETGLYYGGMKQEDLKKSEICQFIVGTFQNVSEGFDVKGLNTLILGSPKGDVIQICGRILRDKPEDRKHVPLIIDIVDDFGSFTNQAKKRHTYYKKCKYEIIDKDNTLVPEKKTVNLPKNVCVIKD